MGSITRAHRRRLRLAVAGAVVLTALTAATAAASAPTQMGGAGARLSRLGVGASSGPATDSSTRPRTPVPGFLLDRGRYTTFDPDDNALTLPLGINDRGEIAGYTAAQFAATADADAHGFVLRRGAGGPVTRIDVPGALGTGAMGINDRGPIVGLYLNPDTAPSRQRAGTQPLPGMGQALTAR